MATNTATKAAQNGAAATDAAFKAATDAATDFARTASEAFAPTMEKATGQVQEYVDVTFAQAKKSSLAMLDAFDAGLDVTLGLHKQLAQISDVDWVKEAVARYTDVASQAGASYSRSARELLK